MRPDVSTKSIEQATDLVFGSLGRATALHGRGSYSSAHEILGVVTEEFHELVDAVKSNRIVRVEHELADIAVACLFGIACIEGGHIKPQHAREAGKEVDRED